jgi:AbrB family looped-hinge helix DNA binding protein
METTEGKFAWMVRIGEKGQFVIPKEAREMFDLQPGCEIIVLGDRERGLAILPREQQGEMIARVFADVQEGWP